MSPLLRDCVTLPDHSTTLQLATRSEQRLIALSELVDAELRGGGVTDNQLAAIARRITGEVDQAFAEEFCWTDAITGHC